MVAGMERYYQIARCYRDEDFRADRQPEFTQLDIEMSFVEQDDVIELGEAIIRELWTLIGVELTTPFQRMTYAEAMARYGSDKPDLRFGNELVECTDYFTGHDVPRLPGGLRRRRRHARRRRASRASSSTPGRSGPSSAAPAASPTSSSRRTASSGGPVAKNLTDAERAGLAAHVGAQPGRLHLLRRRRDQAVAGRCSAPPASRSASAAGSSTRTPGASSGSSTRRCSSRPPTPRPRVTSPSATARGPPCTTPSRRRSRSSIDTFDTDPGSALAYAYDIVCNGNEIGGGSIRIHRRDVQERVFEVMGISQEEAQEKFGFLLDAFAVRRAAARRHRLRLGPHRLAAARTDSIRDVIAFPKSGGGYDPLTAAPAPITPAQRKEAGVDAKPAAAEATTPAA